jgi:hypothetical protein
MAAPATQATAIWIGCTKNQDGRLVWDMQDDGKYSGFCDGQGGEFSGIRYESKGVNDDDDIQAEMYQQSSICTHLTDTALWKMSNICSNNDGPSDEDKHQ